MFTRTEVSHMKSGVVVGALLVAALAVTPAVLGADAPDRPPGVSKEAWIPVTERLGFVIVPQTIGLSGVVLQRLVLTPPVSGYFVLRDASGWLRIVIIEPIRGPADAG
jgi:hypothetical protein